MKKLIGIFVVTFFILSNTICADESSKEQQIQAFIKKLEKVKLDDISTRKDIYKELFKLDPKNVEFREKFVMYQKQDKVNTYIADLKKIPENEYEKRKEIYTFLSQAYPNNNDYKKNIEICSKKIEEQNTIYENETKIFGERPSPNNWNGSYYEVASYLKTIMHDPSSLEFVGCTTVFRMTGKGWIVGCEYRGKNAFGAKVLNANWFTIVQGKVINVEPINKYSFK